MIEELIIESCIKIAKKGNGALIILGGNPKFKLLVEQNIRRFSIRDNPKLFQSLAIMDGAIILDGDGIVMYYGAMIEPVEFSVFKNYGTRHNSGLNASKQGAIVFVVSEEDRKIRIFREGQLSLEIDPTQKDIEKNIPQALNLLDLIPKSLSIGMVGAVGTSIAASIPIGLVLIPGVTVFAGGYLGLQLIKEWIRKWEMERLKNKKDL